MNPRVEKLLNLPAYQRILILFVIMVIIAAGFYFLFYQAQQERHGNLLNKLDSVEAELQKNQKIANNFDVYRAEYEKLQLQLDEALDELPLDKEIPSLLTGEKSASSPT